MNTNRLTHKGFTGTSDVSMEDDCLFGRIQFIDDVITYEGQTTVELKTAFAAAVDRYLAHCKNTGKPANKPFSGTFNVRVGPELHKKTAIQAAAKRLNLNEFVFAALEAATSGDQVSHVEHNHNHRITVLISPQAEQSAWTGQDADKRTEVFNATYAH